MQTPSVIAMISTYNEADIIADVLDHLRAHNVAAYVIDDGSNDGTTEIVEARVGYGVLGLERRPQEEPNHTFRWNEILARKERLASALEADWFIHHDADEFRESPWLGVCLAEAIALVDAAGFNAIDFALLDFWPVEPDSGKAAGDRSRLSHYSAPEDWNRRQVKCWKNLKRAVDLASSGGHDVAFPGRRVFPLRFLLRHYPIRSDEHGRRKVWQERVPRFTADERARGWHVQYDALQAQTSTFVRDSSTLIEFEPTRTRLTIALEDTGRVQTALETAVQDATTLRGLSASIQTERDAMAARIADTLEPALAAAAARIRQLEVALATSRDEVARARARELSAETAWQQRHAATPQDLNVVRDTLADTTAALAAVRAESARLNEALTSQRNAHARLEADANTVWLELQRVYASRTWRWSGILRAIARWLNWGGGKISPGDRSRR